MRQTLGLLVARALEGSWRREPPFLELSQHELGDIATLLAASGAGALAWNRISRIPYLRNQPEASILKESYRAFVVDDIKNGAAIRFLVELFADAGLEPLIFKGSAVAKYYCEPHLRPCGDIDICAPPGRYVESRDLLRRCSRSLGNGPFLINYNLGEKLCLVDLHSNLERFRLPPLKTVYARSELMPLGEISIRVPSAEDHLRLIAIHFLSHGGCRPVWLCDIASMLENLPQDFDWDMCLGGEPRFSQWVSSAIELAHWLLGAHVDGVPSGFRTRQLPAWLTKIVLKEWQTSAAGRGANFPLAYIWARPQRWLNPRNVAADLKERWPNGIQATIETGGRFNQVPRLPYQVCAFGLARIQRVARSRLRLGTGPS